MYEETGFLSSYLHNFSEELHQLEEYCRTQKSNASMSMSDFVQFSAMSEYDLAAEGDLFKAPELIMEEPEIDLDPMTAAISMMSCGEDAKSTDITILQNEQLLSDVFYECKKDLLEKAAMDSPLSEILEIKAPLLKIDENTLQEFKPLPDMTLPKSISSKSLSSMEWIHRSSAKPTFLDIPGLNFDAVYGMRRSFSEGDIKALGNGNNNMNIVQSPPERPLFISNCTSEERLQKLSRYRNKKNKRNFGRKIKYACRKALADSQPRIRGRFAKTEES